jgi:DNA-binding transcriptional ArsR family regulator
MFGRSDRSIRRALKALSDAGIIEVRRRGRKLSNVYRLAKWFWERLTGRDNRPRIRPGRTQALGECLASVIEGARAAWEARQARGAPARA